MTTASGVDAPGERALDQQRIERVEVVDRVGSVFGEHLGALHVAAQDHGRRRERQLVLVLAQNASIAFAFAVQHLCLIRPDTHNIRLAFDDNLLKYI